MPEAGNGVDGAGGRSLTPSGLLSGLLGSALGRRGRVILLLLLLLLLRLALLATAIPATALVVPVQSFSGTVLAQAGHAPHHRAALDAPAGPPAGSVVRHGEYDGCYQQKNRDCRNRNQCDQKPVPSLDRSLVIRRFRRRWCRRLGGRGSRLSGSSRLVGNRRTGGLLGVASFYRLVHSQTSLSIPDRRTWALCRSGRYPFNLRNR